MDALQPHRTVCEPEGVRSGRINCEQVYRVVYEGATPKDAVKELMSRALKPE